MIPSMAAKYGLLAVGYIALHQKERGLSAEVISGKFNIPSYSLYKILFNLTKAEILFSRMGPHGGYVLAREPEKISLFEIIKVIEGSALDPLNFIEDKPNEPFLVKMEEVANKANSELKRILSETTLADMIGSKKK